MDVSQIDADLDYVRAQVEEWMLDEVRITRPSTEQNWNEETGVTEEPTTSTVYEGKGRLSPSRGPSEVALGAEVFTYRDTDLYIPLSAPVPRSDDLVEVITARDSGMQGRVLRITGVTVRSLAVSRHMSCTSQEPSSESFDAP